LHSNEFRHFLNGLAFSEMSASTLWWVGVRSHIV
jgi:hypothetical protein